jgi:hypothetical protein
MKIKSITVLAALLGSVAFSAAQEAERPQRPDRPPGERRGPQMTEEQRAAMREKTAETRKEALAKYDENQNSELDPEEVAKVRLDVIKKFGEEGATQLTPEQRRAAMEAGWGWALARPGGGAGPGREGRPPREGRPEGQGPGPRQPRGGDAPAPEGGE